MGEPDQPGWCFTKQKMQFFPAINRRCYTVCYYDEEKKTPKNMRESTHLFNWEYCINHYHFIIKLTKQNEHSPVFRWTGRQVNQSDNNLTDDKACPPDDFEPQFCDTRGWDASGLLTLIRDLNCFFPFLHMNISQPNTDREHQPWYSI